MRSSYYFQKVGLVKCLLFPEGHGSSQVSVIDFLIIYIYFPNEHNSCSGTEKVRVVFYLDVLTPCWNVCLFQCGMRPKFQVSPSSTGFLERNSQCFFHFSLILSFGGAERLHTIRAFLQMRSIDSTAVDLGILTETIKRRRCGLAIVCCLGRAVDPGYL